MTLLGLDFDNTLVHYDSLFYQLAHEKNLINERIPAKKIAIRDYLRSKGKDEDFTLLQGEVYGLRILEAEAAKGMMTYKKSMKRGVSVVVVSHKTIRPYKGPPYELRRALLIGWINITFDKTGLNLSEDRIFFEEATKENRADKTIGCTHYVDDLKEILEALPKKQTDLVQQGRIQDKYGLENLS